MTDWLCAHAVAYKFGVTVSDLIDAVRPVSEKSVMSADQIISRLYGADTYNLPLDDALKLISMMPNLLER